MLNKRTFFVTFVNLWLLKKYVNSFRHSVSPITMAHTADNLTVQLESLSANQFAQKSRSCFFVFYFMSKLNTNLGRRGRDRMVVELTTTYAISAYHH